MWNNSEENRGRVKSTTQLGRSEREWGAEREGVRKKALLGTTDRSINPGTHIRIQMQIMYRAASGKANLYLAKSQCVGMLPPTDGNTSFSSVCFRIFLCAVHSSFICARSSTADIF